MLLILFRKIIRKWFTDLIWFQLSILSLLSSKHQISLQFMLKTHKTRENVSKLQLGSRWRTEEKWQSNSAMVLDKIEIEVTEKMAVEQWKPFPAKSLRIPRWKSKFCVQSNEICKIQEGWNATYQCRQRTFDGEYDLWIKILGHLPYLCIFKVLLSRQNTLKDGY